MLRQASFVLFVTMGVLSAGASCSSTSGGGGAADASTESSPESSPGDDSGGGTPDGSMDAADAPDAPGCTKHLPAGFSQVLASSTLESSGASPHSLAMALDENDDPMFAYFDFPNGDNQTTGVLKYTRWDRCAGAFTPAIQVDSMHMFNAGGGGGSSLSLAYDPTTHEVGIAYVVALTNDNWANDWGQVWLATMKTPATTFSRQPLSTATYCCYGNGDPVPWPAMTPDIAMQGGNLYVAYMQTSPTLVWFLSSTSTAQPPPPPPETDDGGPLEAGSMGDGSTDAGSEGDASTTEAGTVDAGPPPAHFFAYAAVPYAGPPPDNHAVAGYVEPRQGPRVVSVAIDASGAPGLAIVEEPGQGYDTAWLYWHAGMASAVPVTDTANTQNDETDLTLAYEGTKPRIAGHLVADTTGTYDLTFVASDDGMTWNAPARLPNNSRSQITAFDSWLALDGAGHVSVVADINGGQGNGMDCGANPMVDVSSDDGATWTACGADMSKTHAYSADSLTAIYGRSRIAGKLAVSFLNGETGSDPAHMDQAGIVYWQHP